MEVSNEIKEDIRKTQSDLKNAIKIHQIWIARLRDDEHNSTIKCKIKEAEKDIVAIGQTQKKVVDRLRCELELYQQRLKARNKHVNLELENRNIAQQLRDHQTHFANKHKAVSLLKPSVLNEILIKTENNNTETKSNHTGSNNESDIENDQAVTIELVRNKENENYTEIDHLDGKYSGNVHSYTVNNVQDCRTSFTNILNKANDTIHRSRNLSGLWEDARSITSGRETPDASPIASPTVSPAASAAPTPAASPTASPAPSPAVTPPASAVDSPAHSPIHSPAPSPLLLPPLPRPDVFLTQELFLRHCGLITRLQRDNYEKKRRERKRRSTTSTNKNEFIYGNFDLPKRKKYNQFPYLSSHCTPPQTRSQRLRKLHKQEKRHNATREDSPSSSSDNKAGSGSGSGSGNNDGNNVSVPGTPAGTGWTASLPRGLTLEPVYQARKRACARCGRTDVPSLLINCAHCGCYFHTGCSSSPPRASPGCGVRPCPQCGQDVKENKIPNMSIIATAAHSQISPDLFQERVKERARLQERNAQLCMELRKLEVRAASLKENMDEHSADKRQLLSHQIQTQRNLQKLLDFVGQFKETSISIRSTSCSDTGSEQSRSNED